jgi:hypothetical protein
VRAQATRRSPSRASASRRRGGRRGQGACRQSGQFPERRQRQRGRGVPAAEPRSRAAGVLRGDRLAGCSAITGRGSCVSQPRGGSPRGGVNGRCMPGPSVCDAVARGLARRRAAWRGPPKRSSARSDGDAAPIAATGSRPTCESPRPWINKDSYVDVSVLTC